MKMNRRKFITLLIVGALAFRFGKQSRTAKGPLKEAMFWRRVESS